MYFHGSRRGLTISILTVICSSHASATTCSNSTAFTINATASADLQSSFKAPTGPLSDGTNTWKWHLDTESYRSTSSPNTSIHQAVWLDVQPPIDLTSPNLGYLGCGLVIHGLKTSVLQKAVGHSNGTCDNLLSATCVTELLTGSAQYATELSHSDFTPIHDICDEFRTLGGSWKANGVTSKCSDDLTDQAWIEAFPFASPELSSQNCTVDNTTVQHDAQEPLLSWGVSAYSESNFAAYDNLTRSVTPLISVMFVNHTTDSNTTLGYSQSQLSCLYPTVVNGSRMPSEPLTSGAGKDRWLDIGMLVVVMAGLVNNLGLHL